MMNAIDALHSRVSVTRMTDAPLPAGTVEALLKAAVRAPDHLLLRPWRFVILEGEQRAQLGRVYAEAVHANVPHASEAFIEKCATRLQRAPVVIVAVAEVEEGHKVPVLEQVISTGAAVQNMLVAAHALGVGAVWRTGDMASCPEVKAALGFAPKDVIVSFLYLGMPAAPLKPVPALPVEQFVREWPAQ